MPPVGQGRNGMSNATIRDVAREAGVSVASVSRALNGRESVHSDTLEKIMKAVDALGYVPHAAARSLSLARSHAIGVVVPALHGEFFSELLRGMDDAATASGYQLLLSTLKNDADLNRATLRSMRGRVDGLIVMDPQIDVASLDKLLPQGVPAVLVICASSGDHPSIGIDNRAGAAAIAEHLLSLGKRRIVHIMGPERNIDARERFEGFNSALHRSSAHATLVTMPGDFMEEAGARAVGRLIDSGQPFDAIFAANDMMALGAIQELQRRGISVPEDVAVAGFDDIPLARFMGLTTASVHMAELGHQAVQLLVGQLAGEPSDATDIRLKPALVVRNSTAPAA